MNDKIKQSTDTVLQFIQTTIKKAKSIDDILIKGRSENGFLYERLWDICIKFGQFHLIEGKTDVKHYFGNINTGADAVKLNKKIFKNEFLDKPVISGKSGGYSDISFRVTDDGVEREYISSCKFFESEKEIDKYDLQKLCTLFNLKSENTNIKKDHNILLFVNDKEKFIKKVNNANASSSKLISYISPHGNYENVYDKIDLQRYYVELRKVLNLYNYFSKDSDYSTFADKYLNSNKHQVFNPKFHQHLFIEKIMQLLEKPDNDKILVGAVPRSGKTYIIAGTVLEYVKQHQDKNCKFVIITPVPTETIEQYKDVFNDYIDFINLEIGTNEVIDLSNMDKKKKDDKQKQKHQVYLVSKQRLGYPDKSDDDIAADTVLYKKTKEAIQSNVHRYFGMDIDLDLIFLDEAHLGMTTEISKLIIEALNDNNKTPKIYITATYNKPSKIYDIPYKNKILWDINDIQMLKNLGKRNDIKMFMTLYYKFLQIFGKQVLNKVLTKYNYDLHNIFNHQYKHNKNVIKLIAREYNHYPEPYLLTTVWKDYTAIYNEIAKAEGTNYSFDIDKLFMVDKDRFANEEQVAELLHYYFGYPRKSLQIDNTKDSIPISYKAQAFYKENGIMPRIRHICTNTCRTLQQQHTTSQLWFLPFGPKRPIEPTVKCLINLLENKFKYIFEKYIFLICTDKTKEKDFHQENVFIYKNGDIKEFIRKHEVQAQSEGREGVIILTAGKLQVGISLSNVDIVCLFNNITSSDTIYQMMFRSMTEVDDRTDCDGNSFCPKKKYGFIVDMNPQRTILYIEHIAEQLLNKHNNHLSREDRFELITDLFNIDKDIFTNNYDSKQNVKEFAIELFNRLNTDYTARIKDINDRLDDFKFDFKPDVEKQLKTIFQGSVQKSKKKKEVLYKEGIDHVSKKLSVKSPVYTEVNEVNEVSEVNEINIEQEAKLFLSEVIFIASLLTTHTKQFEGIKECIFEKSRNNKSIVSDFDRLLRYIEKEDENIRPIFMHKIYNRFHISHEDIFNVTRELIKSIQIQQKVTGGNMYIDNNIYLTKNKIYNITEPEKLLEYIHANLAPNTKEKQERGEVFTNPKLIEEMMDKLPADVWSNPDLKWLDPAAGMGNFPVIVYNRLMRGLRNNRGFRHKSEDDIRRHILEKMLYMVEIDKYNIYIIKKIFCADKYELNIYEGSFINTDDNIDKLFINTKRKDNKAFESKVDAFDRKFDIVMGNPPYNENGIRAMRAKQLIADKKKKTIFPDFVVKSFEFLKDKGYLLFIIPLYWLKIFDDNKILLNMHKMLLEKHIIWLQLWDNAKSKDINAEIPLSIFLLKNIPNNEKQLTAIQSILNRSKLNQINHEYLNIEQSIPIAYHNILNKLYKFIKKHKLELDYKKDTTGSSDPRRIELSKLKEFTLNDKYAVDTYTIKDGVLVKQTKHLHPNADKQKLIIANKMSFNGIFIDKGKLGLTGNKKYYILGDKLQLIKKLLGFKITNIICISTKYYQDYLDTAAFDYIPDIRKLDIKEDITEEEFYDLIGLTQKEKKQIEEFTS
jgi:hypothetical protein